jgi:AraC-like DNA-binding protein
MKALFEKVDLSDRQGLLSKHFRCQAFDTPYHFHPEYELTFIVEGKGQRFVGDRVHAFSAPDLVLLGPHLPHFWCSSGLSGSEAVVVQFTSLFVESVIRPFEVFRPITALLEASDRGCVFDIEATRTAQDTLMRIASQSPFDQCITLLTLLYELGRHPTRALASEGYVIHESRSTESYRMQRIIDFTVAHFKEPIRIGEVAAVASMSISAFCRFFRSKTGDTYFLYLQRIRIAQACTLLRNEREYSVAEVAYESGFGNLSHFHKVFLREMGQSPLQYQKQWRSFS